TRLPKEIREVLSFPLRSIEELKIFNGLLSNSDWSYQSSLALGNRYGARGCTVEAFMKDTLSDLFDVVLRAQMSWKGWKGETAAGSEHSTDENDSAHSQTVKPGFRMVDVGGRILQMLRAALKYGQGRDMLSAADSIMFGKLMQRCFTGDVGPVAAQKRKARQQKQNELVASGVRSPYQRPKKKALIDAGAGEAAKAKRKPRGKGREKAKETRNGSASQSLISKFLKEPSNSQSVVGDGDLNVSATGQDLEGMISQKDPLL